MDLTTKVLVLTWCLPASEEVTLWKETATEWTVSSAVFVSTAESVGFLRACMCECVCVCGYLENAFTHSSSSLKRPCDKRLSAGVLPELLDVCPFFSKCPFSLGVVSAAVWDGAWFRDGKTAKDCGSFRSGVCGACSCVSCWPAFEMWSLDSVRVFEETSSLVCVEIRADPIRFDVHLTPAHFVVSLPSAVCLPRVRVVALGAPHPWRAPSYNKLEGQG